MVRKDEITKEELKLVKRLVKVTKEKNLFETEEELFEKLRKTIENEINISFIF